ncbi:MAG: NAD(P)-binding domain-containing protein [Bacteroidota bacterium]|nr:NAD(P)-binding domain-containing protein [Bacteroidota bacterium]
MNEFGIIGVGRIGASMARNMLSKGIKMSLYDKNFINSDNELNSSLIYDDLAEFVNSISKPRKILIFVPSGGPSDEVISELIQNLDSNDIIIDGGNTNPNVSFDNHQKVKSKNLLYLGMGVSGGVKGVLEGPSIMIGGDIKAYDQIKNSLSLITSKTIDNSQSFKLFGDSNQGHFVKMIHNGIEYVEMQLISSVYYIMINSKKYNYDDIAKIFEKWNDSELESYLLEISIRKILEKTDDGHLIDRIDDEAEDNGTGRWMLNYAIELGCSVNMLNAALDSRFISKSKDDRKKISEKTEVSHKNYEIDIDALTKAYSFCRLINFIQAFLLINSANKKYGWNISVSDVLNVWSNGSIIKSSLINSLYKNYSVNNIIGDKKIFKDLNELKSGLIDTLSTSLKNDVSVPCFNEALIYFNQMSSATLSTKLIQAQRNYFGSHKIKLN